MTTNNNNNNIIIIYKKNIIGTEEDCYKDQKGSKVFNTYVKAYKVYDIVCGIQETFENSCCWLLLIEKPFDYL